MGKSKKKVNKHKRVVLGAVAGLLLSIMSLGFGGGSSKSDQWLKDRVVKLRGNGMLCSGEQIQAPSGQTYILSAAHCHKLAVNESIEVETEDRKTLQRKVIAEDKFSDLLLIEGLPNKTGLKIADKDYKHQKVRTFTHGGGMDTYETRGELIQYISIPVMIGEIITDEDLQACESMPKYKVREWWLGRMCIMDVLETATTAMIVPGSSGGMVVDDDGGLVGVVSAGGDGFGYLVTLKDIQRFLSAY